MLDDCIENNKQTWRRGRVDEDHRDLRAITLKLDPSFDPAQYANFNRHLA
jgi:hypothetical protein